MRQGSPSLYIFQSPIQHTEQIGVNFRRILNGNFLINHTEASFSRSICSHAVYRHAVR